MKTISLVSSPAAEYCFQSFMTFTPLPQRLLWLKSEMKFMPLIFFASFETFRL